MDAIEKQFRNKIVVRLVFRRFLAHSVIWLFAWGLVAFVLRAVFGIPAFAVWAGFAGLLPILIAAVIVEVKKRPDRSRICAYLDRYNRLGGLMMAANEADVSEWHWEGIVRCPSVLWRGYREWTVFALSILFVCGCAFIPARFAGSDPKARLEIDDSLAALENKIEALEQLDLIDSDKADGLEAELARIGENALGEDPAGVWEALDHLEEGIRAEAEDFAENTESKIDDLNQAQRLAGILGEMSDLRPDVREESMKELMDALRKAADDDLELGEHLDPDIRKAIADGKPLSKEQLDRLRSSLKDCKNDMVRKLAQLSESRMADGKTCENASEKAKQGNEALAEFLEDKKKELTASEISIYCKWPGKGPPTRGRADAPMTWKDETEEHGARFNEQILPVTAVPEDITLVGFSKAAPKINEEGAATRPGTLAGTSGGNGSAIVHRTLPRHRGAVKRYFERGE